MKQKREVWIKFACGCIDLRSNQLTPDGKRPMRYRCLEHRLGPVGYMVHCISCGCEIWRTRGTGELKYCRDCDLARRRKKRGVSTPMPKVVMPAHSLETWQPGDPLPCVRCPRSHKPKEICAEKCIRLKSWQNPTDYFFINRNQAEHSPVHLP